jgi:cob(I)alamin adenosyltransferase
LNAFLGDAKAALNGSPTAEIITGIQKDLFSLMGILAGMPVSDGCGTERLDTLIAQLESELPPFTSFAVPGANPASAKLHIARTICRRVERRFVGFKFAEETKCVLVPYINRLSDLLFLLAQKEAAE